MTEDDDFYYPEEMPARRVTEHPGPETSPITEDDDEQTADDK